MKNLFLTMSAAAVLFAGCSKEQTTETGQEQEAIVAKVIEFDNRMLQFANMEELDAAIAEVAMMNSEQKLAWEASHEGFVSMNAAARTVAGQMKADGSREGVLTLQKAYSELFIFAPARQEVSAVPLFKSNRVGYAYVCNAYGDVEVAGQVVNLNDIASYAETWVGKAMTDTRANPVNRLILTAGNHRFIAVSTYNDDLGMGKQIFIRYSSQLSYSGVWYPSDDQYTVSYEPGLTNNAGINFDTRFNYASLKAVGDSFKNFTRFPDYMCDEFVGYGKMFNTGYRIASLYTRQNDVLPVVN